MGRAMRFGIFVSTAGRQSAGPETYETCLVREMLALDRENEYHVFCLNEAARRSFGIEQDNLSYHVLWPDNRWVSTLTSLPLAIRRTGVDLLHATVVAPPVSPQDYVFTMHCFSSFVHPELYPARIRVPLNSLILRGLRRSRLSLCVSGVVRDLVAERWGIPVEKMRVVHNGAGAEFRPVPDEEARATVRERHGIRDPYLLFVGQLKARKNVIRIVEAFARARAELGLPELKLVLAGRRIWSADGIDEAIAAQGVRDHVVELGHLALADLPALYSAARLFVFPSLWEGFGIPVIEAMACGVPVVTSNVSALPEVAGGAALLVDPHRSDDIAGGIVRVLRDGGVREELRRKGFERARHLTWRETARNTLAAYHEALGA